MSGIGNALRTDFVMRFVCSECGSKLRMSSAIKNKIETESGGIHQSAYNLIRDIGVEPCHKCLEPVRKMKGALDTLKDLTEAIKS